MVTAHRHADAVARRARAAAGVEPVTILKPRDSRAWIDLYLASARAAARLADEAQRWPWVAAVVVRPYRFSDWQRMLQRECPPLPIGRRWYVVPAERGPVRMPRGRCVLRVVPGTGFGTGHHFTTRFCLERIEEVFDRGGMGRTVLDLGTGSGILAIAAARLGARVVAVDNDPMAVAVAQDHVRLNRVSKYVRVELRDVTQWWPRWKPDVICANLYGPLLLSISEALGRTARRGLILSGLREAEADEVVGPLIRLGWREVVRDGDGEWCGVELRRTTPREK